MARLLVLMLVASCAPILCTGRVAATFEREQSTGLPIVTVRCDGQTLARRVCYDGGRIHRDAGVAVVLCDGVTLTTVKEPKDATETRR